MLLLEGVEESIAEWTDVLIFNRRSHVIVNYSSIFQNMGLLKDLQVKSGSRAEIEKLWHIWHAKCRHFMLLLRHCTLMQNANSSKTSSTSYQQSFRKADFLEQINKVLTGEVTRERKGLLPGSVKELEQLFLEAG